MKERRILQRLPALAVRETGKEPAIIGYAAVFYRADDPGTEFELWTGCKERIMPGCFDRAMREDDCRGLFNHDPNCVLGRTKAGTMRLSIDAMGLQYEIAPSSVTINSDVREMIKRGDVTGSSFSFEVTDQDDIVEDGIRIRQIRGVKLYDVGPVTFPAYESTTAEARKADTEGAREYFHKQQEALAAKAARLNSYSTRARLVELGIA